MSNLISTNGDWGLGIGGWGLGPIPNPQSPIPNIKKNQVNKIIIISVYLNNVIIINHLHDRQ